MRPYFMFAALVAAGSIIFLTVACAQPGSGPARVEPLLENAANASGPG